jgi:hypothetical protein
MMADGNPTGSTDDGTLVLTREEHEHIMQQLAAVRDGLGELRQRIASSPGCYFSAPPCQYCGGSKEWTKAPDHYESERAWARHTALIRVAHGPEGIGKLHYVAEHTFWALVKEGEILTVDALEEALADGSVLDVEGIGPKTVDKLRLAVQHYRGTHREPVSS